MSFKMGDKPVIKNVSTQTIVRSPPGTTNSYGHNGEKHVNSEHNQTSSSSEENIENASCILTKYQPQPHQETLNNDKKSQNKYKVVCSDAT